MHRRLGSTVGVARALEAFDRPSWLYRSRGLVPRGTLYFRSPQPVTESDLALCQRLVDAYRLAQREAPSQQGVWSHSVFRGRQRGLRQALERGDTATLAKLLASMFRSDFVLGMADGSLFSEGHSGPAARLSWLRTLNKLAALAESLGTARVENPEQGGVAIALANGVEDLVGKIEAQLGLPLDFPEVGAAYGVMAGKRLITPDSPDQLYAAVRLRDVIETYSPRISRPWRVVEIGGGYGGMAYWLLQILDARYVIVDLPLINVLHGYFLSQALGVAEVAFFGEAPAKVTIVPGHALASVEGPFDVLANKDSFPEIPGQAARDYLRWARSECTGLFYSYNHEAAGAPFGGSPQIVVSEVLSEVGGFTRVSREASWLRRGYVEEVYIPGRRAGFQPFERHIRSARRASALGFADGDREALR